MGNAKRKVSALADEDFLRGEQEKVHSQGDNQQSIVILSPHQMVRTFLKGMLLFQGYQSNTETTLDTLLSENMLRSGQIVFLDGVYLTGSESERVCQRVEDLQHAGVCFVVVAEERLEQRLSKILEPHRIPILWNPLDYRQVGDVMAQMELELRRM